MHDRARTTPELRALSVGFTSNYRRPYLYCCASTKGWTSVLLTKTDYNSVVPHSMSHQPLWYKELEHNLKYETSYRECDVSASECKVSSTYFVITTFEIHFHMVEINWCVRYLGHVSFNSKAIVQRHIYRTDCSTRASKVVSIEAECLCLHSAIN